MNVVNPHPAEKAATAMDVDTTGKGLHYEDHPAAEPNTESAADAVILIHGWACDLSDWETLVDPLTTIARVVAVDLPGHGRSGLSCSGYTVSAMAADVLTLLDGLGLAKVVLIGHSAGAEVAAKIAVCHPDRVHALVAVDPGYGFGQERKPDIEKLSQTLRVKAPNEVAAEFFAELDNNGVTPGWVAAKHARSAQACRPEVVREMFHSFAFGQDSFHFRPSTEAFLKRRTCPLLGIYRNTARGSIGRHFMTNTHDRVYAYQNAGHWPHQEQPEHFVAEVKAWLRSLQ